ncbi:hypothetical protein pb186bvf_016721 [Paramecium bursaria]
MYYKDKILGKKRIYTKKKITLLKINTNQICINSFLKTMQRTDQTFEEQIISKSIKSDDATGISLQTTMSRKQSVDIFEEQSNDSSIEYQEDISDLWDLSSICTDMHSNGYKKIKFLQILPPTWQEESTPNIDGVYMSQRVQTLDNGKCIAEIVRGQGSIGLKRSKKQQKELLKSIQKKPRCDHKILVSFLMLEEEILQQAEARATTFLKKFNSLSEGYQNIKSMVVEVYRIILIPDSILKQLVEVLDHQQIQVQAFNAYEKLNLKHNRHPLADKAAQKIKQFFGY